MGDNAFRSFFPKPFFCGALARSHPSLLGTTCYGPDMIVLERVRGNYASAS